MSDVKPSETNTPPAAAETPSSALAVAEQQISLILSQTRIEPPNSDAIASEPPKPEAAAAPPPIEPPKAVETPKPIELPKPEAVAPLAADKPKVAPVKLTAAAAESQDSSRSNRFAAMAASVAFAAAIGSLVGALAFSVISRPGPASASSSASALDLSKLQDTITSVRSEIVALKASIDSGARNTNAQFAKAAERFERIERAQSASAAQLTKSIESLDRRTDSASTAKETTGSVTPPRDDGLRGPILDGWHVRNVVRNVAFIQGRRIGVIEVETGDIVPGIGRIQAIRKHSDGRWLVVTSKGLITSR